MDRALELYAAFDEIQRLKQVIERLYEKLAYSRGEAWNEAAQMACYLCRQGYPLQKNGEWHDDMDGKDTLLNNLGLGAEYRAKGRRNNLKDGESGYA